LSLPPYAGPWEFELLLKVDGVNKEVLHFCLPECIYQLVSESQPP
jgi:hypothetical protein